MLYLIRHGQSANNAVFAAHATRVTRADGIGWGYRGRVPDPPLTPLGHRQAAALARALRVPCPPLAPTHLYSSLPLRAVQTAAHLADALDRDVALRADLHEVGGIHRFDHATGARHAMPGCSLREVAQACPRAVVPADAELDAPWPGGFETEDDALPRARNLLADLRRIHGGSADAVALVTHQHFSQFLLAALLGLAGPPWRRFRIDNTALVAIDLSGDHPRIDWINRSDHLHPHEVTN